MISEIISKIKGSQITTYFIAKTIPAIFGYFFVLFTVKLYGLEIYGKYSLFLSQIVLLSTIVIGYFNIGQTRYYTKISQNEYESAKILAFILASISIIIFLLFFTNYYKGIDIFVLIFFAFAFVFYRVRITNLQVTLRSKKFLYSEVIRSLLLVIFPSLFWFWFSKSLEGLVISIAATFLIAYLFSAKTKKFNFDFNSALKVLKLFFKYSWPLSLFVFITQGFQFTDKLFITHFLGETENGAYCSTYDVVYKSFVFILFPIIMSEFPKMINYWNSNKKNEARNVLRNAIKLQLTISCILFFISLFVAYKVLKFILPEVINYISYFDVLFMILSAMVWQFGLLYHKTLEFYEKTLIMFLFVFISWLANVALIYFLIQKIGLTIVPLSFLISSIIYNLLIFNYTKKLNAFN